MLKYSKVVGMPILALKEGRKVGHVHDLLVNLEHKFAAGICAVNILKRKCSILLTNVTYTDGGMVIQDEGMIEKSDNELSLRKKLIGVKDMLNKKVLTNKGDDLGRINDIYFDLDVGTIDAVEVTDGIIQDIISGRKIIPVIGNIVIKEEGIFISREAFEEIIESKNGLENLFFSK